jgi:2-octaprenyl-6-methoxyphenol hydroxylase
MGESAGRVDVAILGAGPVGCALALALQGSGASVALLGRPALSVAAEPATRAFRPLALSYASRLILERLAAWEGLATTPIEEIHVSQSGGFGRTRISSADAGVPALGYVTGYADVAAHLAGAVDASLRWPASSPKPQARLVVHAEGAADHAMASKDYGQVAIVAAVECELPAGHVAWERFSAEGPIALLPHQGGYGLVWSRSSEAAASLMEMGDTGFLAELQAAFGRRAGRFVRTGARSATPLALRYRASRSPAGEIHIGNAAQTLHPVAGQGLNLGLRDARELADLIRASPADALGSPAFAERFARTRRLDARATIRATDLFATLYVRRDPLSAVLRGAALAALDVIPPARRVFARRMIFGASAW